MYSTSSDSNVQSTINQYKLSQGLEIDNTLTDEQRVVLDKSLYSIGSQIDFLINLSKSNDAGKIQTDKIAWANTQHHLLVNLSSFFNRRKGYTISCW